MKKIFSIFSFSIAAAALLHGAEADNAAAKEKFQLWDSVEKIPYRVAADANRTYKLPASKDKNARIFVSNAPELIYYPAPGDGEKPAVMVCPGGGYAYLSIKTEGVSICEYFNKLGFSAFLLKYRTLGRKRTECAFADAARAMRFIRYNSRNFAINPDRIGVIGFSAGGHVAATISAPAKEPYAAADDLDKLSFRPNFSMLIYPAYLAEKDLTIHPEFKIDSTLPPTFIVQTQDDFVGVENAVAWYVAAKNAGVETEMHLFPKGRHGYALKKIKLPVANWPVLLKNWLKYTNNKKSSSKK